MINVTNIERFATHDGPGIRTTVFLKGCPLFCPWCANPETQSLNPELMYTKRQCVGCRACEAACPTRAITFDKDGIFRYNQYQCIFCRACEQTCLQDAIEFHGNGMELQDIMAEVMKDKDYYDNSGGGITVSGGEPFVQTDALLAILKVSKEYGINTAVETTGSYSLEILKQAEPYVDYFLYDFKHLNNRKLKEVAGGNGELIKANLKYLIEKNPYKVNVRMPIIPKFNFEDGLIKETLDYLHEIGVRKVNLLPYHTLGKMKYEKMGQIYQVEGNMIYEEDLEIYHRYALALGMESLIGA